MAIIEVYDQHDDKSPECPHRPVIGPFIKGKPIYYVRGGLEHFEKLSMKKILTLDLNLVLYKTVDFILIFKKYNL